MYQILINIAQPLVKAIGLFSSKIKKGVEGRKHTLDILEAANIKDHKNLWFHCASLGEYEQGLPVFTAIKNKFPNHNLVLTFFSPSGYEIRKSNPITSIVCYLPLDTKSNAKAFIDIVKPELSVFVKYDIWPNYIHEIYKRNLKMVLISALFRKNQIYFKSYGKIMTATIKKFSHIFTQNQESIDLLKKINYSNFSLSGDTRFDRVSNQLVTNNTLDFIEEFKDQKLCIVFGSSWREDAELFIDFKADRKIITKPIKGTMPRYDDPDLDQQSKDQLIHSQKDQAENVMIVDLLRNDLSVYAETGSVKTPKLFNIESFKLFIKFTKFILI